MKKIFYFIAIAFLLNSCDNNDVKSSKAEIIVLSVSSIYTIDIILKDILIDSDNNKIFIFLNNDLNNFNFPILLSVNYELSSEATTNSISNNEISFTNPDDVVTLEIRAEDGTIKEWYVALVHKQIQNSDFEDWFDNKAMDGSFYTEIGLSAEKSVWATANLGTSLYKVFGTQPVYENPKTYVKIETLRPSSSVPLAAGTIFTGKFDLSKAIANPLDPEKATNQGTPFTFKPTKFRVKFSYESSTPYIQVTFNNSGSIFGGNSVEEIAGEDECAIYAILESRDGDNITEIAKAELFSKTTAGVIEQYIDFNYTSIANPTHISVVFSSSKNGHYWKGAVGSKLLIEEFELMYEL